MMIELWPIDRPIPYARNCRKISDKAVDKVAASIKEFGWRQPIVVDKEGVIVVGHARLLAARKLALREVPVHVALDLTPAQVKAYRIMDNRSHEETEWDFELLGPELEELNSLDVDLSLTGFDAREIDALLLDTELDAREDLIPDLPEHPVTRAGDLWVLGGPQGHRVLCADSTSGEAVSRLLGSAKPFLMTTDPPYGVSYDPAWRVEHDGGGRHALGMVANDDRVDWTPSLQLFPGDVAYVWHAGVHAGEVAASLERIGFGIRSQIIWSKQHLSSAAATITGSTSPAGTPCVRVGSHAGAATARSPPFGRCRT